MSDNEFFGGKFIHIQVYVRRLQLLCMKATTIMGILPVLCLVLIIAGVSADQEFKSKELQELMRVFTDAVNAKDAERVARLFASDGRRMAPKDYTRVGFEEIKSAYKGLFESGLDVELLGFRLVKVIYRGDDIAVVEWICSLQIDGKPFEHKDLFVYTKEGEKLKILAGMYNERS